MSERARLLAEASRLITGDRNNQYGPPTQDFTRTALVLSALGFKFGPNDELIASHHVALIMAAVKLSRLTWSPEKRDSWTDLAGYAACGYECVTEERKADGDSDQGSTWKELLGGDGGARSVVGSDGRYRSRIAQRG